MDRSDIEEMAKDLIPLAESTNAGEALMTTDHDDKWSLSWDSGRKRNIERDLNPEVVYVWRLFEFRVVRLCLKA